MAGPREGEKPAAALREAADLCYNGGGVMRVRFGQERFRETNAALNAAFAEKKVLVAAHRGSWGGNILQNTRAAYTAALRLGADMVESDTSATSDGVVYSFHNGYERLVLGVEGKDISEMTSAQVDALCPRNVLYEQCSRRLDRLDDVLRHLCHGELINIDRIWRCPDRVLEVLDRHPAARMQCFSGWSLARVLGVISPKIRTITVSTMVEIRGP